MARTTANMRGANIAYVYHGPGGCGFCTSRTTTGVRHDLCKPEINTTSEGRKDNVVWRCRCAQKGHQP